MSVSTSIVAVIDNGPHELEYVALLRPRLSFELILWEGSYLEHARLVMYRRVSWYPGQLMVHYVCDEGDEGASA